MKATMGRVTDRVLSLFVPPATAAASSLVLWKDCVNNDSCGRYGNRWLIYNADGTTRWGSCCVPQ